MNSTTTTTNNSEDLTRKIKLPQWLAAIDKAENRVTMMRETATILKELAGKVQYKMNPADVSIWTVDEIPFNASYELRVPKEAAGRAKANFTFGALLYYILTGKHIQSEQQWIRLRLMCGLSFEATVLLDSIFHFDADLDTVDLCPAALYARPTPARLGVSPNHGKKMGLLVFGLTALTIVLIAIMAQDQELVQGYGVTWWANHAEELKVQDYQSRANLNRQTQRVVQLEGAYRNLKRRQEVTLAELERSLDNERLCRTSLTQRVGEIQELRATVGQFQSQLNQKEEIINELVREKQAPRELKQCRANLKEFQRQIALANNEINDISFARQRENAEYHSATEDYKRTVENMDAQIDELKSTVEMQDLVRGMKDTSLEVLENLANVGSQWKKKLTKKLNWKGFSEQIKQTLETLRNQGSSCHDCSAYVDKLKSKMGVMQGDYDACMNELRRVRTSRQEQF